MRSYCPAIERTEEKSPNWGIAKYQGSEVEMSEVFSEDSKEAGDGAHGEE